MAFCNTFAVDQKYVEGAEEPNEWYVELRRDLRATREEIAVIKGVWVRALRKWSMLVRREVGVFRRRLRAGREEIEPLRDDVKEVGSGRRPTRWPAVGEVVSEGAHAVGEVLSEGAHAVGEALSEGAHAVRAEMREASKELRALRERGPAKYGHIDVRMPRDADDFETVCAQWMRMAGFSDVRRTPKGPDGGVDVIASTAVGQAKFHPSQKVSAEAIRALVGSKIERGKDRALFFHYGPGYTPAAIDTAINTKVELYQLDVESQRFMRVA